MRVPQPRIGLRSIGSFAALLLAVLIMPAAIAGCGGTNGPSMAPPAAGASATSEPGASSGEAPGMVDDGMGGQMATADAAAWQQRPDFVRANGSATELAYAYAIEHPEVIAWMPCYCGCAAMGHQSNLDCFVKPRAAGGALSFEEHASYCDVCVKTALTAKALRGEGRNLSQIRQVVDQTFAGSAPGTPTKLPPAT